MTKQSTIYLLGTALLASVSINLFSFKSKKESVKQQVVQNVNDCADPCSKPYPGLPYGIAKSMIDNYGNRQYRFINDNATIEGRANAGATYNFADARNIYYDLDTIKQFICTIEKIVAAKHLKKNNGDTIKSCDLGIKIYYAAYPKSNPINPAKGLPKTKGLLDTKGLPITNSLPLTNRLPLNYEGLHTIVMVATYRDADKIVKAFDPALSKNGQPFTDFKQLSPTAKVIMLNSATVNVSESNPLIRNHGTLCPPPSNCPMEDALLN